MQDIMRKIHGLIKNQDENWRIRTIEEIDVLIKHADVKYIKKQSIKWVGRILRMDKGQ